MKRCAKCNSLMPDDAIRCIKCGSETRPAAIEPPKKSAVESPVPARDTQGPQRTNWTRIFAAVLSSKLFFLASCTGGMAVGSIGYEGTESGTRGDKVRPLDTRMAIIAVVPDAGKSDAPKLVQTSLRQLEKFKQDNPDFSFLPPVGKGEMSERVQFTRTEYAITSDGPGKVLVETTFHDDEHHVLGRYAATDKEIRPLYTRFKHDFIAFWVGMAIGMPLAIVLALTGSFLNWRVRRSSGGTAGVSSTSISRPKSGILFKTIAALVVVVLVFAMLISMF